MALSRCLGSIHRGQHTLRTRPAFQTRALASLSSPKLSPSTRDEYDADLSSGFSTLMLHHGQPLDEANRARAPPIYASTSFCFKSAEHGANLFALKELGPIYSRIMNPTTHMLEYRLAKLEGSPCQLDGAHPSGLVVASGQAAQMKTILTICKAGDTFISSSELYGGTHAQFAHTFKAMGITVKFIDIMNYEVELAKAFDEIGEDNVKCVYTETLSNPGYNVPDFEGVSKMCKAKKTPLIVDNTFGMGGWACRPMKFGADIVIGSATKWVGGHGTTIGGYIVDGHSFDWSVKKADGASKFPSLNDPCAAYHGMNFNAVFGPEGPFKVNMAFIFHARVCALRDMGGCQSPFGSFQLLQGVETLALRGRAHCENTNTMALWLSKHPAVAWVSHPSLENHRSHKTAQKYFRKDCYGAVLSFGCKGGFEAGKVFVDSLKMSSHLANVGDAKTLVIHPTSTTHQQLTEEEQRAAGVSPDMLRVSIGFEDLDDIQADFDMALKASQAK